MEEDFKAVPILAMHKTGEGFQLKFDVFEEIFDNVRDTPVAIISLAGPFRKGKSFMLNLLADYLHEHQSQHWYKDGEKILPNVFGFRGGTQRDTVGVHITKRPFMLKDNMGQDVAVFLMDTQGMFDMKTTAKDCSIIFALSTLLSSVQVYNLSGQIQENDLQHLQVFTNYAKYIADKKRDGNASTAPFQGLLFLLRNWEQLDFDFGFNGGARYLDTVMEVHIEENKMVRQSLKDSFSDVCCTLVPHPGNTIARRGKEKSDVHYRDIDEDFITEVNALAKNLFNKESLITKKLNGGVLTGEGLIDLAIEYTKILSDGKMPKVDSIVKSSQRIVFLGKIKQFEIEYKMNMQKKIGSTAIDPSWLKDFHEECLVIARKQFQEHDVLEDAEDSKANLEQMETNIGIMRISLNADNNAKIEHIMTQLDEIIAKAAKVYYRELQVFARGKYMKNISRATENAMKKVNVMFKKSTRDFDQQWVTKKNSDLKNEIDNKWLEFEKENESLKAVSELDLSLVIQEAEQKYLDEMEKALGQNTENFDVQAHDVGLVAALEVFNSLDFGSNTDYKKSTKKELKRTLLEQFYIYKKRFDDAQEHHVLDIFQKAANQYSNHITKTWGDQYMMEKDLDRMHKEAAKVALGVVHNVSGRGNKFVALCKEKIEAVLEEEKKSLTKKNNFLKRTAEHRFVVRRKSVAKAYYDGMMQDVHDMYVEDRQLQEKHVKALEDSLNKFCRLRSQPLTEFEQNEKALKEDIEILFDKVKEENVKTEQSIRNKLAQFHEKLASDYFGKMYEITRKRYANVNTLTAMHKSFKAAVKREVERFIPFEKLRQETVKICCLNLDVKFEVVKAGSTMWNSFTENVANSSIAGGNTGKGIIGIPGYVIGSAVGGVVGAFTGLAKAAMKLDVKMDISNIPSIKYLEGLKIGSYNRTIKIVP